MDKMISVHDTFLEQPSSGTQKQPSSGMLKIKRLECQITQSFEKKVDFSERRNIVDSKAVILQIQLIASVFWDIKENDMDISK